MELHVEVIRDKKAIYTELLQCQSPGHQLAICYNSGGKLLVKICKVTNVNPETDGVVVVTLHTEQNEVTTDEKIRLDSIESIYPIYPLPSY